VNHVVSLGAYARIQWNVSRKPPTPDYHQYVNLTLWTTRKSYNWSYKFKWWRKITKTNSQTSWSTHTNRKLGFGRNSYNLSKRQVGVSEQTARCTSFLKLSVKPRGFELPKTKMNSVFSEPSEAS
jgi:hypothetical protein